MKQKPLLLWGVAILLLASYVAILFRTIADNEHNIQVEIYQNWKEHYIVSTKEGAFVNTGTTKQTALSEAQGYGIGYHDFSG